MSSLRQCMNANGLPKKTYKTFELAVKWAKRANNNPKFIHKQVAYKCRICLKFHAGKSEHGTLLVHKINIYENRTVEKT